MFQVRGRVRILVMFLTMAMTGGAAHAVDLSKARPHVTFNLASLHVGAEQHYNERNWGVGVGFHAPSHDGNWMFGVEVGQYRNSQYQQSQYVVATADRKVAALGPETDLSLGVIAGVANYHEGAAGFAKKGIPTFGDWIIAGGATVSVRQNDRIEYRMGIHPAPDVADVLLTFQIRLNL